MMFKSYYSELNPSTGTWSLYFCIRSFAWRGQTGDYLKDIADERLLVSDLLVSEARQQSLRQVAWDRRCKDACVGLVCCVYKDTEMGMCSVSRIWFVVSELAVPCRDRH